MRCSRRASGRRLQSLRSVSPELGIHRVYLRRLPATTNHDRAFPAAVKSELVVDVYRVDRASNKRTKAEFRTYKVKGLAQMRCIHENDAVSFLMPSILPEISIKSCSHNEQHLSSTWVELTSGKLVRPLFGLLTPHLCQKLQTVIRHIVVIRTGQETADVQNKLQLLDQPPG